jgi:hypothetical protein
MDFIEQLFGFAPDGGNGFTEACVLAAATIVMCGLARTWRVSRFATKRSA